jgi:hypothetical protein
MADIPYNYYAPVSGYKADCFITAQSAGFNAQQNRSTMSTKVRRFITLSPGTSDRFRVEKPHSPLGILAPVESSQRRVKYVFGKKNVVPMENRLDIRHLLEYDLVQKIENERGISRYTEPINREPTFLPIDVSKCVGDEAPGADFLVRLAAPCKCLRGLPQMECPVDV